MALAGHGLLRSPPRSLLLFTAYRNCLYRSRQQLGHKFSSSARAALPTLGDVANSIRPRSRPEESTLDPTAELQAIFNKDRDPDLSPYNLGALSSSSEGQVPRVHTIHTYATKHNTHITLVSPDQKCMMSVSAGNIGFRKAARGTYDAAYQLISFVFGQIQNKAEWNTEIRSLELSFRGFGIGREAITKALMGTEGARLRNRIVRVRDATRLKFGGTRSKKPRRLG